MANGSTYAPTIDPNVSIWKTKQYWRRTYRRLTVRLSDGIPHAALFQFK